MATSTTPTAADTEARLIEALTNAGIPEPDEMTTTRGQLRVRWSDRDVAVVIELDPGMPR